MSSSARELSASDLTASPAGEALRSLLAATHERARLALGEAAAAVTPRHQPPLRALLVWAHLAVIASRRVSDGLPRAALAGDHPAPLDGWRAWRAAAPRGDRAPAAVVHEPGEVRS